MRLTSNKPHIACQFLALLLQEVVFHLSFEILGCRVVTSLCPTLPQIPSLAIVFGRGCPLRLRVLNHTQRRAKIYLELYVQDAQVYLPLYALFHPWVLGLLFITVLCPRYSARPYVCEIWYGFLAYQMQLVLLCVELILVLRVYALYNQSIKIGVLLICILCMSNTTEAIFSLRSVRGTAYDMNCMALDTPRDITQFGAALLFTHTAIFTLTIFKRNVVTRNRWRGVPILRVMIRDGAIVFCVIAVLATVTIPYSLLVRPLGHYLFPWFTVFPSIVACRLIVNMQRLHDPSPSSSTSTTGSNPELSTDFASPSNSSTAHIVASRWPGAFVHF
ncbi:hypothetical protein BDN72DRAFT_454063 [Pluteus cervinus]|uniref:Uncharacterized protein n=1 Tax=Pluteus cervinus TaxID=181527 RepID=A0ACD3BDF3_9AGAR|nr:hypothetical protein BDN72DRAFT_454063 [Pluteus cervinus]